jgi:hypothetical protein
MNWIPDKDLDVKNEMIPNMTDYGECGDRHTLLQTLKLWKAAIDHFYINNENPYHPIRHIRPAICSYYNLTKGKIDVETHFTRLAQNPLHNLSPGAFLHEYLEILALINAHHIYNFSIMEPALQTVQDVKTFHNLLYNNHQSTLKYFLGECAIQFGGMHSVSVSTCNQDQKEIKSGQKRLYYNSEEGQSIRFNSQQKHEIVLATSREKCAFCLNGRPRHKCSVCDKFLCTRNRNKDDGESKTCFESFHDATLKLKCKGK